MYNQPRSTKQVLLVGIIACAVLLAGAFPATSQAKPEAVAPPLGQAQSFAVLGGSTVTNTGTSTVRGDLGVWPGTAITGFPPGIVVPPGTIHSGDAVAQQAQSDVTTAYNNLAGQPCNSDLTGQDLGGKTLTSGVYCFPSTSAQLTGVLTLDAQGDSSAVFIFQIGTTLTTASNSSVLIINGGSDCNVFWQIGTSATLGTTTAFKGNILALASITLNTSANIDSGRALARNGAVTMDTNTVSITGCAAAVTNTPTKTATKTLTKTPRPTNTRTRIPRTPTNTPLPATQTAIAATRTAIAATQTATAMTLTPTKTPVPGGGGGGGGNQATPIPTAIPVSTATPTEAISILLPTTGGPGPYDLGLIWLALAVAGAILGAAMVGYPLLFKRRR